MHSGKGRETKGTQLIILAVMIGSLWSSVAVVVVVAVIKSGHL